MKSTKIAPIKETKLDALHRDIQERQLGRYWAVNNEEVEALKIDMARIMAAVSYENADKFLPLVKQNRMD